MSSTCYRPANTDGVRSIEEPVFARGLGLGVNGRALTVYEFMRVVHDAGADGWHIVNMLREGSLRNAHIVDVDAFETQLAWVSRRHPSLFEYVPADV